MGLAQSAGSKRFNPVGPGSILGEVMFARMIILGCDHVCMMILASVAFLGDQELTQRTPPDRASWCLSRWQ